MRVPHSGIFASTSFFACLVGLVINIHDNIIYDNIYMASVSKTNEAKAAEGDTHAEVHANNTIKVTKEQLNDEQKQKLAKAVEK